MVLVWSPALEVIFNQGRFGMGSEVSEELMVFSRF